MDRKKWMYDAARNSKEYIEGVHEFMEFALEDMRKKSDEYLICPCVDCGNTKRRQEVDVRSHLFRRGFKRKYTNWYCHGEGLVVEEVNSAPVNSVPVSGINVNVDSFDENENVENLVDDDDVFENFDDVPNMENNEMDDNELDELMHDVEAEFVDIPNFFTKMSVDSKKPLFPNCTKYTKLSAVFKLFNLKAKNGWSETSFNSLLELLGDMLPENNELPVSTYLVRKM